MITSSKKRRPVAEPAEARPLPNRADEVCEFLTTFCRVVEGPARRQTLVVRPWQRDEILVPLFTLRPDGLRQYRTALIGLASKNGKSLLCAGLALYFLIADGEPGAQVFSCAGDKEQARLVFRAAKQMVEFDPDLSRALKTYRDAIEHPRSGSVYRVVSADAPTKEGVNPHAVIFDEVHIQPSRELWDVMTMRSGTRMQPIHIGITTAGFDVDNTLCGELYTYGKKVRAGEVADPTFFFYWREPRDPNCDWRDERIWHEVNPALDDFLDIGALRKDAREKPESVFRRYHLNQWVAAQTLWLPYGAWGACADPAVGFDRALPLHVGTDVGIRHDSSAVAAAQRQGDRVVLRCRIWENPFPEGDPRHDDWKLNIAEIENWLVELYEQFPAPASEIDGEVRSGPAYLYDPAFFERSAQELEGAGLTLIDFPQTDARMCPASQALYNAVVSKTLAHDGDPVLARHVANVVADQKSRGAWRISKPKGSRRKIDGAVASAMAVWHATLAEPAPRRSVYEDRGILVL